MNGRDVLVAGQGMADENGVGLGVVQAADGRVGDAQGRERYAAVERQRPVAARSRR